VTYATSQNCIDRFGSDVVITATDRTNTGTLGVALLAKALADADSTINSYVSGLPGFPFTPVPDAFEKLACDIALYYAALPASAATEEMRQRYEDAIDYLKLVGKQQIRLPYSAGAGFVAPNSTADIVQGERLFTRTTLGELF